MNILIRTETEQDVSIITGIHDLAFEGESEGILVEKLRRKTEFVPELSIVAEVDGKVVGHILYYPIAIDSKEETYQSLALGPMGVLPDYQNAGVGIRLVKEGLGKAESLGYKSVIVLGHAGYYPRFGFRPASTWRIKPPFDAPDEAFMAIELVEGEPMNKQGVVKYPLEYLDA